MLGRAMHHLVLGEPFFSKLFVIRPEEINGKEYHWNNKDWKKWYTVNFHTHSSCFLLRFLLIPL